MLQDVLTILNKEISSKNLIITSKPNSIFSLLEQTPNELGPIAKAISTKVSAELILIRTKLIPFMNELVEQIENKLAEFSEENELAKYKIVTVNYPVVIDELETLGKLPPQREPRTIGVTQLGIPTPDISVIARYFKNQNASIDAYNMFLIDNYKPEGLAALWDKYLVSMSGSNTNIASLGLDTVDKVNDLILLLTALDNLTIEHMETNNTPLLGIMQALRDEIANYLLIVKNSVLQNRSIERVILSVRDTVAYVDEDNYNKFLDSGKTSDVILGYILSGKYDPLNSTLTALTNNAQDYVNAWRAKVNMSNYAETVKAYNKYKVLYELILRELFNPELKIPLDLQELVEVDYPKAHETLAKILKELSNTEMLDINMVARLMVGEVIFPNTNFASFSKNMIEYGKLNKDISPADAATYASIEFILDFLLQQVELGDGNGLVATTKP